MSILYPWMFFFLIPLFLLYINNPKESDKQKKRQTTLLYLSLFFIIISLSRVVIQEVPNEQKFDGDEFIIALDISYSMQAKDLKPSRYEAAKESIKKILTTQSKNRFSIFVFTTNTMLISPPTTDTTISLMALNSLEPKYILTKGTSLSNLIKTISKLPLKKKKLLIFSDGGEQKNIDEIVKLCKKNHIMPYIVATGTTKGSVLKKGFKSIKDSQQNLVISKINPMLKDWANRCGGRYYELQDSSVNIPYQIISDIKLDKILNTKTTIKVKNNKELFYIPLLLAIMLFFLAITKLHQLYIVVIALFLPHPAHSSMVDFYHLNRANEFFKHSKYIQSADEFSKLSPSIQSYYNQGVAYYKAKKYKIAMEYFSQIKSSDKKIKQKLFYNMGNCAMRLKKYNRAKIYYQKALSIGYDEDSFYNLCLIYKLKLKQTKDLSKSLPKQSSKKQTQASQKKQKAKNKKQKKQQKRTNPKYKLGYKAYELINKGYTDEKSPW